VESQEYASSESKRLLRWLRRAMIVFSAFALYHFVGNVGLAIVFLSSAYPGPHWAEFLAAIVRFPFFRIGSYGRPTLLETNVTRFLVLGTINAMLWVASTAYIGRFVGDLGLSFAGSAAKFTSRHHSVVGPIRRPRLSVLAIFACAVAVVADPIGAVSSESAGNNGLVTTTATFFAIRLLPDIVAFCITILAAYRIHLQRKQIRGWPFVVAALILIAFWFLALQAFPF
jgi:hypothetical protein